MKQLYISLLMSGLIAACSAPNNQPNKGAVADSPAPTVSAESNTSDTKSTPIAEADNKKDGAETIPYNPNSTEIVELIWDDLMPEGEFERLEALYEDYFTKLQDSMGQQQSLMDAAKQGDLDITQSIAEGSDEDSMEQLGTYNVVDSLNGQAVRIPGYVVPLDFSAKSEYKEFLLVPYFGACLHTPPPPPNQIVFVKAEPAAKVDNIYDPVWLEGTMKTGRYISELGNSAYELKLSKIEPYEY